jgi:uncharacterized protein with beta-barrel porin domain
MRKVLQGLVAWLHAVEDHLTVRTQITAAVAAMAIVLVGALAAAAALVSFNNTAELTNSRLAGIAATTSGRLDRYMATRQQELSLFSRLEPMRSAWQGDPAQLRRSLD